MKHFNAHISSAVPSRICLSCSNLQIFSTIGHFHEIKLISGEK